MKTNKQTKNKGYLSALFCWGGQGVPQRKKWRDEQRQGSYAKSS